MDRLEEKIDRLVDATGDIRTMIAELKVITEQQAADIIRNYKAYCELERRIDAMEHWQMRVKERFIVFGSLGVVFYTVLDKIGMFNFLSNIWGGK